MENLKVKSVEKSIEQSIKKTVKKLNKKIVIFIVFSILTFLMYLSFDHWWELINITYNGIHAICFALFDILILLFFIYLELLKMNSKNMDK